MHSDSHSSTHAVADTHTRTRTHKCATISGFHKVLQNPHSLQHGSKHNYMRTGDTIKSLLLALHCLPRKQNKHTGLHKFSTCSTVSESAFTVRTYMILVHSRLNTSLIVVTALNPLFAQRPFIQTYPELQKLTDKPFSR